MSSFMKEGNHLEFKKSIQKLFVKNNREKYDEITKALESGDTKQAYILAHNVKSSAGHLGKILLQRAAEKIEYNLREGENIVTPEQLAVLKTELDAALAEFEVNLTSPAEEQAEVFFGFTGKSDDGQETPDECSVPELFEKLKPMLESGNPESWQFIGRLRLIPGSEELIQQLTDLDFEQAVFTLAELRKKLEHEKDIHS